MAGKPLKGSETPRVFTPPLRDLTPETSKGFACIEFAEEILEITLLPWQKWLLIHALELLPDGTYRFRTVVLLVARQNGKSTVMLVLALWRMFADAAPLVIGTAQNLDTAEELWTSAYELAESIPELAEMIDTVDKTNGKKALRLTTGERYKIAAASRRGGRGLSGDLVLLDEVREHQTWDAWAAVTKTTLARIFAQIWAASNAGDLASVVLRHLRSIAHAALGYPDGRLGLDPVVESESAYEADDSLGIFEWSAAPDRAVHDRQGWAEANPSLGYTITERAIASAARTDPEAVFRMEVLCQWATLVVGGPFGTGKWIEARDPLSKRAPNAPVYLCVEVSHDRTFAHIGFASLREDGLAHVGLMASRAGTDWVVPWLTSPERRFKPAGITFQTRGAPVSSLLGEFEKAGLTVTGWDGPELVRWTGQFLDAVNGGKVRHRDQPVLDVAAMTAVLKKLGDGRVIDRTNSPEDAGPVSAVTGAYGLMMNPPTPQKVTRIRTIGG